MIDKVNLFSNVVSQSAGQRERKFASLNGNFTFEARLLIISLRKLKLRGDWYRSEKKVIGINGRLKMHRRIILEMFGRDVSTMNIWKSGSSFYVTIEVR